MSGVSGGGAGDAGRSVGGGVGEWDGPGDGSLAGADRDGECRGAIGTNSPGFQVCGCRRTAGSFRNRSAWPHARQMRVPSESSPRVRSDRVPRPIEPVRRSFAHTKSFAPQLLQIGAKSFPTRE